VHFVISEVCSTAQIRRQGLLKCSEKPEAGARNGMHVNLVHALHIADIPGIATSRVVDDG
jgi:hypothetical protein